MEYGRLVAYKADGRDINISFENASLRITAITDTILRVLNPLWNENYKSIAIEGDKCLETSVEVEEKNGTVIISTPEVRLEVGDFGRLEFKDNSGKSLLRTFEGKRTIASRMTEKDKKMLESEGHSFVEYQEKEHAVEILFELEDRDCFYGLGDKTGFLNKRGYAFENWNSDIPSLHHENMPALYKSIPFLMGKREDNVFGLFFDNTFHSYIDLGKESEEYFFYGAQDGNLDFYFMAGAELKDIVREYTYLTGRPGLPMLWTLGYHQCRWGYENEQDIARIAGRMRECRIPCESVQYDIDYMVGYRVFTWDEEAYGKKGQLISRLKEDGFKPVVIIDPGTKKDPDYFMYKEGLEKGYFALDKDGQVYENAVWPGISTYPDFGKREVREWWAKAHEKLTEIGVLGVWNDMNEPASFNGPLPDDVQMSVDDRMTTHAEAHNTYGHFMSMATYEGMKKLTGKRPLVITRAAYAGTQKYSTVWTGDNQSVWSHLRMLIPQLCNLGMSGFSIAGTDIGGFGGDSNPELMSRWIEAAVFSTFFRNHSAKGTKMQEPWQFNEATLNIYRKYVELHYRFLPYIYDLLHESQTTGLPVMRPLVLMYENDRNVLNINDEYMVGENLLVAPVVEPGATRRMVYLPEGKWVNFWNGEKYMGGCYIIVEAPIDVLPLFVKEGSITPTYEVVQYVGEKPYEKLILLSTGANAKYTHYQDNGEDFAYEAGEYNLYEFSTDENGALNEKMIHEGYKKYRNIEIINL